MMRRFVWSIVILAVLPLLWSCATTGTPQPAEGEGEEPAGEEEGVVTSLYGEESPEAVPEGEGQPVPEEGEAVSGGEEGGMAGSEPGDPREPEAVPHETDLGVGGDILNQEYLAARDQSDWGLAEEKLKALSRLSPDDAKVKFDLAVVLVRLGHLEGAVEAARSAFDLDSKNVEAARLVITLLRELELSEDAEAFAESASATDPQNVDLQNLRLEVLLLKREYLRVQREARALLKQDEINVGVMKCLGRSYFLTEKYKTAKYVFKRALELAKDDYEILYYLARITHKTEKRDRERVLVSYGRVLAVKKDFPEALNNVGLIFYDTRNYEQAAQKFGEAVRYAPDFREAKLNLANSLRGMKQYVEADKLYVELNDSHPAFAAAYFNRGLLYLENEFGGMDKTDRLEKAADCLRQYKEVAGRELRANDPADQYIREAQELATQMRQAQVEESRLQAEQEAKFQRLKPEAEESIGQHREQRQKLVDAMEAWKSAENMEKVNMFEGVIAEYDEMVGSLYADLRSAVENKVPDDVEYLLEEVKTASEEFQPIIDEAFEEPPPEVTPPPEEPLPEEPGMEEPPLEEPPLEEPPVEEEDTWPGEE